MKVSLDSGEWSDKNAWRQCFSCKVYIERERERQPPTASI